VDGADPAEVFIVEWAGEPVGLIQRYQTDDEPVWTATLRAAGHRERSIGIDYLIGREDRIGIGLGPAIIDAFVAATWDRYPGVSVVAVAVQQDNRRSWRALEKAGFRRFWAGVLESDDPSDEGPSYLYLRRRPPPTGLSGSGPPPPR
jgi:aminoglycoside 6'-N-acetyltransferase